MRSAHRDFRFPEFRLYPVADSADWARALLEHGIRIVQLRLKTRPEADPCREVARTVAAGKLHDAKVLVNDHWQLALEHGAFGVHLSRARWESADLSAIASAGMVIGASVHCEGEIDQALSLNPDYLTVGTVFPSPSKTHPVTTLGLDRFRELRHRIPLPVVAIGGITVESAPALLRAGADAIGLISDLRSAPNLGARIAAWKGAMEITG